METKLTQGLAGRGNGRSYAAEVNRRLTGEEISDLVGRVRSGDGKAWDTIVRCLSPAVYRGIGAFTLSPDARDEVFSATWLRLIERIDTIDKPESLVSWLMTTARNEARQFVRKRSRQVPMDDVGEYDVDHQELDESLLDSELRVALLRSFRRLPERCQSILRLVTVDPPLSYAEITKLVGIPHGSIGPNRLRCLDLLRSMPELAPFVDAR